MASTQVGAIVACCLRSSDLLQVCEEVKEVATRHRCTTTYTRRCEGPHHNTRSAVIMMITTSVTNGRPRRKGGRRRPRRSPVGILQAVLLANALSARHPENEVISGGH